MKRTMLSLIVIFLVTACSPDTASQQFDVSNLQTVVASTLQASANQPTNDILPQTSVVETLRALTQQPTVSTSTADPVKIATTPTIIEPSLTRLVAVPTMPDNLPYPIQFEANGTYIEILVDTIPAGNDRTFSVRAMKGQIMSIATWRLDGTNETAITSPSPEQIKDQCCLLAVNLTPLSCPRVSANIFVQHTTEAPRL